MIEYKIKHPHFLITALKSVVGCDTDQTLFQFGGGLRTFGLDPSRISVYEVVIGESQIDIIQDGKIEIMIDVPSLDKVLKRFSHPDSLSIIYDNNQIKIRGKINNRTKTFTLKALDEEPDIDPIPALNNLRLNSIFNIELSEFLDMLGDVDIYAESFNLITKGNEIIMEAFGAVGQAETKYELDDDVTSKEICNYSLVKAKGILKELGNQNVTISFGKALPMMIFTKLTDDSYVKWYLAPRVEEDEWDE